LVNRCRRGSDLQGDAGSSLVEVLVGMALLAAVVLGTLRGVMVTMSASSIAKERAVATSLVSGDLAQVEALPFSSLQSGLNPAADSLSTDPRVSTSVSSGVTTYVFRLNNATIPTSNTATAQSPLVPHITTVKIGIPYQVATYPTVASSAPGVVTVTVVVSWRSPSGGTLTAVGETLVTAQ
jgi:hypothetical protein